MICKTIIVMLLVSLLQYYPSHCCNMKAGGGFGSESAIFMNPDKQVPRPAAVAECLKNEMQLAQFYDENTKLAVSEFIKNDPNSAVGYWIGLKEYDNLRNFKYDDGTVRTYGDWSKDFEAVYAEDRLEHPFCIFMDKGEPDRLSVDSCNKGYRRVLCTSKIKEQSFILEEETNKKCADSISITWAATIHTANFNYNIRVINLDTHLDDPPLIIRVQAGVAGVPKNTKLKEGLIPYTNYRIELSMCTTVCCCGPTKSVISEVFFRGGPVSPTNFEMQFNSDRNECQLMWMIPENMPKDEFDGFKIIAKSNFASDLDSDDDVYIRKSIFNIDIQTKYSFRTEPNQRYIVTIQTKGCGRLSKKVKAEGECTTRLTGPDFIPSPGLMIMSNGQYTLRLTMPKENNGPISCIFVLMRPAEKRMLSSTSSRYSLKQLKEASKNIADLNKEFIAMAFKRSDIQDDHIDIHLNQSKPSSCNIGHDGSPSNEYKSTNFVINPDWYYSIVLVTSTPSFEEVHFKKSVSTLLPAKVQMSRSSVKTVELQSDNEEIVPQDPVECSSVGTILSVLFAILLLIALGGLIIVKRKVDSQTGEEDEKDKEQKSSIKEKKGKEKEETVSKPKGKEGERDRKQRKHRRHRHEKDIP